MLGFLKSRQVARGDTIIEVLFAITVFSMVAIGGMTIMNQGTAVSQRALEITLVRHEIDTQAESLRFAHDAYVASYADDGAAPVGAASTWSEIRTNYAVTTPASAYGSMVSEDTNLCGYDLPENAFLIDPKTLQIHERGSLSTQDQRLPQTYAQIRYHTDGTFLQGEGIWVEAERHLRDTSSGRPGYIDFHIRSCWSPPGSNGPITLGTIVRLYEP